MKLKLKVDRYIDRSLSGDLVGKSLFNAFVVVVDELKCQTPSLYQKSLERLQLHGFVFTSSSSELALGFPKSSPPGSCEAATVKL